MHRVGLKLQRSDHPEVSAATPESPEKILMIRIVRRENSALGSHNLARQQIIDGHAVLAKQPANTTAEGQTSNSGFRDNATRDCQTEDVRFAIQISQSGFARSSGCETMRAHRRFNWSCSSRSHPFETS